MCVSQWRAGDIRRPFCVSLFDTFAHICEREQSNGTACEHTCVCLAKKNDEKRSVYIQITSTTHRSHVTRNRVWLGVDVSVCVCVIMRAHDHYGMRIPCGTW